jgi:hypothetical protein
MGQSSFNSGFRYELKHNAGADNITAPETTNIVMMMMMMMIIIIIMKCIQNFSPKA